MEAKENMYVRTLNGIIKIDKIKNGVIKDTKGYLHYGDFIIASYNIIDLIEVGDYVNGYYVEDIRHRYDNGEDITILNCATGSNYFENPMYDEDIKSILTKEQFEQMKYEVE